MAALDTSIRAAALAMAGELTESEAALLDTVCDGVRAELSARLRRGVSPEDCAEAFVPAAAIAASAIFRAAGRQDVAAFQAGTVSVSMDREQTHEHYAMALRLLSPWLDGGTAFLGV